MRRRQAPARPVSNSYRPGVTSSGRSRRRTGCSARRCRRRGTGPCGSCRRRDRRRRCTAPRTRSRGGRRRSTAAVRIVGVTSGISPSLVCRVGHVVGSPRDQRVDLAALDAPLEDQLAGTRRTSGTPARRSGTRRRSRRSGSTSGMPLFSARCSSRIVLVAGAPQPPIVRFTPPFSVVLGDQRAGLGLRHQDRRAGVLQRSDAVQHRRCRGPRASSAGRAAGSRRSGIRPA